MDIKTFMFSRDRIVTTGRTANRFSQQQREHLNERLKDYRFVVEHDPLAFPKIELEIGIGNGDAMLKRATSDPGRLFIGSEVYLNGLNSLVYALDGIDRVVENIRLVKGDVRDLLSGMPQSIFDRILLPYPDPWVKTRHIKRRLIQADFLMEIARVLAPGGDFWVITDVRDYAEYVQSLISVREQFESVLSPSGNHYLDPPSWWLKTKFQLRAEKAARESLWLCFRRKS